MSLTLRIKLLLVALTLCQFSFAQIQESITPRSYLYAHLLPVVSEVVSVPFDKVKANNIDLSDSKNGHAPKFAQMAPTDISLNNTGLWSRLPNGDKIWRVRIQSAGALGLIPCTDQMYLPKGATLHLYTPDGEEVIGAYTTENNPSDGYYNLGLIHGEECTIEYYEPVAVSGQGRLHIQQVGHAYRMVPGYKKSRAFGDSDPCEVNVNCSEGNTWQDQKNAVVRILVITGGQAGWCSGALINNTNNDCTPYILSADHCYQDDNTGTVPTASELGMWKFYFNFESPSCTNPASVGTLGNHFVTGCTLKAASLDLGGASGSDFVLVKANTNPPTSYSPYFAGWNRSNTGSPNGVSIHHPNDDIKKISTYTTTLTSTTWGGNVINTHWKVLWAATTNGNGVTEPGSSGSPIFDNNKRIVGTLTGGGSSCTATTSKDSYGKMSYHWTSNGTSPSQQLKSWLDPAGTGATTLDGKYATCGTNIALDAGVDSILPSTTVCSANAVVSVLVRNYGITPLTSVKLSYTIDGNTQVLTSPVTINSQQSARISLPAQNYAIGSHSVEVIVSYPNGGTDGNNSNDTISGTFTVAAGSGAYQFSLSTSNLASQITWDLEDSVGNVLYSGGSYRNTAASQLITQSWCLPIGCYTFNISNSASNGLNGSGGKSGTYSVVDKNNNTVISLLDVNFGGAESQTFCVTTSTAIDELSRAATLSIFPNPSSGLITISQVADVAEVTITDALGRVVKRINLNHEPTLEIDLSHEASGIYFVKTNTGVVRRLVKE